MAFVFSLWDLGLLFAVSSVTMLVASEIVSPYYGRINLLIEVKKMRKIAILLGLAFLLIASLRIASIIYS
ncbi:MAG: hypothetical protein QXU32_02635 [Nitrososphaerales archaeon]